MRFLTHIGVSMAALSCSVAAQGFEDSSEHYHSLLLARDNYILARQEYLQTRDLLEHALQARGRPGSNSAFDSPARGRPGHVDNDAGHGSGRRGYVSRPPGNFHVDHGNDHGGYGSGRRGYNTGITPHTFSHSDHGGQDTNEPAHLARPAFRKGYVAPA